MQKDLLSRSDDARADLAALAGRVAGLMGDIRSDHAGETGAVMIYRGIISGSRDPGVLRFAAAHKATEAEHLALLEVLLPARSRSILLPIWRVAGFFTGFLPALFGPRAVYATVAAVETFVDGHYAEQIAKLPPSALRDVLALCRTDELHHRDEAQAADPASPGWALRVWGRLVGTGSALAVVAARRI